MLQPRAAPPGLFVLTGLVVLFFLYFPSFRALRDYPSDLYRSYSRHQPESTNSDITNSTLGFQRVFAVGLPERSDKRDALALTSSLTGFNIAWINGVHGESVPDKALPYGVDRTRLWENNLGSWRGHMNAIRTIVEQGLSTALILEDDVDWDIRLQSQLQLISDGTRFLQPQTFRTYISPYGNDWDLIWLGHCGEIFPETLEENQSNPDPNLARKYTINPDPTVPPPEHTKGLQNYTAGPYTRWVHVTGGPICTFAYALSLEGARKVLYDLSVDHLAGPFDNALAGLCRWGRAPERLGMRCFSVTPPVFGTHKKKGTVSGDSDIQGIGSQDVREEGLTENIVWSTRLNIRELLLGLPLRSQFEREYEV